MYEKVNNYTLLTTVFIDPITNSYNFHLTSSISYHHFSTFKWEG